MVCYKTMLADVKSFLLVFGLYLQGFGWELTGVHFTGRDRSSSSKIRHLDTKWKSSGAL